MTNAFPFLFSEPDQFPEKRKHHFVETLHGKKSKDAYSHYLMMCHEMSVFTLVMAVQTVLLIWMIFDTFSDTSDDESAGQGAHSIQNIPLNKNEMILNDSDDDNVSSPEYTKEFMHVSKRYRLVWLTWI